MERNKFKWDKIKISRACQSSIGKKTPEALYIHISALTKLPGILRTYESCIRCHIAIDKANIIKLRWTKPQISYLFYPDFDSDPHPALAYSLKFNLNTLKSEYRDYTKSKNPFILHRKELFVAPDYPNYEKFKRLTQKEETCGLYETPNLIGTHKGWQAILALKKVYFKGHSLYFKT